MRTYKRHEQFQNEWGDTVQVDDIWSPIPHYECVRLITSTEKGEVYQTRMRRLESHPDGPTDWFPAP